MISNLVIQASTREEMLAAINHYVRNIPVPDKYALELRLDWAACPLPDYYAMSGQLLAKTIPMP